MQQRIFPILTGIMKKQWFRYLYHFMFWLVSLSFFLIFYSNYNRDVQITFWITGMLLPLAIFMVYFFNYYLIPKFLYQKKYWRFTLYSFYTILSSFWLSMIMVLVLILLFLKRHTDYFDSSFIEPVFQIVGLYFVIFLAIAIKQIKRAFEMQQVNAELEKNRLETSLKLREAELKLLRAQIHPHFLFNTLNNLYGLTLEKSDMAPQLVLRLSDLMDYMLYKCQGNRVQLKKELEHLGNYIEIERIRYAQKLNLSFNVSGEIKNQQIAPMILLPFIENAFKHGVSKQVENPYVQISFKIDGNSLKLEVVNSKNKAVVFTEDYTKGIGLKNVRKRLELLYPEKYKLEIDPGETEFSVNLELKLETEK